jgi:manganese transport system permease protein
MLVISAAVAVAAAVAGVFLSFHLNVSTGGAIVLAQSSAFTLAYLFSPRQGVLRRGRAARGTGARAVGRGRTRPAKEPS